MKRSSALTLGTGAALFLTVTLLLLRHSSDTIASGASAAASETATIFRTDTPPAATAQKGERTGATRTTRPRTAADPKVLATRVIALLGNKEVPEKDRYTQLMDLMEEASDFDRGGLLTLYREVAAAGSLDEESRAYAVSCALQLLAAADPKAALDLYVQLDETSGAGSSAELSPRDLLNTLSDRDPAQAAEWYLQHADSMKALQSDAGQLLLGIIVKKAFQRSPELALSILSQTPVKTLPTAIQGIGAYTSAQQSQLLEALRKNAGASPASENATALHDLLLSKLGSQRTDSAFDTTQAWMKSEQLTPAEQEQFVSGIEPEKNPAEQGRWLAWMEQNLPPTAADQAVSRMIGRSPAAAASWALQLPTGPRREEVLKSARAAWESRDPEAAARFAEENSLTK